MNLTQTLPELATTTEKFIWQNHETTRALFSWKLITHRLLFTGMLNADQSTDEMMVYDLTCDRFTPLFTLRGKFRGYRFANLGSVTVRIPRSAANSEREILWFLKNYTLHLVPNNY